MSQHTPGPWRYDYAPGDCGELLAANGTTIAEFVIEPSEGNARLIAAAPELLEEAKRMQGWIAVLLNTLDADLDSFEIELSNSKTGQSTTISLKDQFLKASAAIAKAEGNKNV